MSAVRPPQVPAQRMTAEEFFALGEDVMGELVDGVFVPMTPAGGPHGSINTRITAALGAFVYPRELGELFDGQTGFILRRRPDVVRCPDVAFVAAARLPGGVRGGPLELAPDLAVEVLSPSNTAAEMLRKLNDYLTHGVRLVWEIDPDARSVVVHTPDAPARWLAIGDTLDAAAVLPGFTTPVASLFAGLAAADPRPTD
jgi:Uma2 family endonuclease